MLPSWRGPGRVPEGPWEVILGTFLRLGWRERVKGPKSANKHRFLKHLLHAFSYRFRVYSVRLGARRRKSTTSKLLKTISFCGGICVCAICARSTTNLQTERKSNKIRVKSHTKSTLSRKLQTTSKKCRFENQNASQNRPRRPGRAPGPPPARDFRQNNFHFWLLPGSKSASKSKLEFEVIFERFCCGGLVSL